MDGRTSDCEVQGILLQLQFYYESVVCWKCMSSIQLLDLAYPFHQWLNSIRGHDIWFISLYILPIQPRASLK